MSIRSQQRKVNDKRKAALAMQYSRARSNWREREPSRWRIFAWLKWKSECPKKPKWLDEYEDLEERYGRNYWRYR